MAIKYLLFVKKGLLIAIGVGIAVVIAIAVISSMPEEEATITESPPLDTAEEVPKEGKVFEVFLSDGMSSVDNP